MFKKMVILLASVLFSSQSYASFIYDCKFYKTSNDKEVKKLKQPFELKIMSDETRNLHYLIGNAGSSKLTKINHLNGVNFIEVSDMGNVTVTTITYEGKAIHSRNSVLFKELVPSQYYGSCTVQ